MSTEPTTTTITTHATPNARTHSFTRSVLVVLRYELRKTLRNPVVALIGLGQPLLYLLLFGPLLTGIAELGGDTNNHAYTVFVPGLFIMLALFGGAFTGITLVSEYRSGSLERLFTTPLSRTAILAGRVICDTLVLLVETLLVAAVATLLGFRAEPLRLLVCLGLVVLTAIAMTSLSHLIALTTKSEDALSNVANAVLLPILLIAGVMLPMSLAPSWLQTLSHFNPLTYVVDAARAAIAGNNNDGTLLLGYLVAMVVAVGAFAITVRTFNTQD